MWHNLNRASEFNWNRQGADSVNGFIVMQGETYTEEKKAGILWSPQKDKSGSVPHSYRRMKEVEKGDRIFHYVKGFIVAISVAEDNCTEVAKPKISGFSKYGNNSGYLVMADYHELENPLSIGKHIESIKQYLPVKYSAFQSDGTGNPGYLFPCNEELTLQFLDLISLQNINIPDIEQLELAIEVVRRSEHNPLINLIAETEMAAKMKMRRGREEVRKKMLEVWHHRCPVCGIELDALLKASPSKPWKDSTDQERMDPFNGLLLCSNHDAMYSQGLITFNGRGKLMVSNDIPETSFDTNRLEKGKNILMWPKNRPYFVWHKKYIFYGNKI